MSQRIVKKKVNLLGDPAVGKTSLVLRFVKDVFGDKYLKTIGTNVYSKKVPIVGAEVKMMIYDIMGEKNFEYVQETSFRQSSGAIAVADATRMETLDSLVDNWIPKYKEVAKENPCLILAVNKMDLEDQIEIEKDFVVKEFSSFFDYVFFTSAKTGKDVENSFQELASRTLFKTTRSSRKVEDIIAEKYIDTPHKLMEALLAYTSELGEIPYEEREEILSNSNISKFKLEDNIDEKRVYNFAENIIEWYEGNDFQDASESVKNLIERYEENT